MNVPYTQISRDIDSVYGIKISTNILRSFAHSTLGVEKQNKTTSKSSKTETVKEILKLRGVNDYIFKVLSNKKPSNQNGSRVCFI